ncbi:MAG: nitrilase-related carbon-nitrogen hydrolase [Hyphomicrobiaceae bacterium]
MVFPGAVIQGPERPKVLLNVTNDGWFGTTIGPYQHFQQSRVRAVEEGLPLIRSANNGISAIIDGRGRVLQRLELNAVGVIDGTLPGAEAPTFYGRYRELMFWGLVVLLALVVGALHGRARRGHHPD